MGPHESKFQGGKGHSQQSPQTAKCTVSRGHSQQSPQTAHTVGENLYQLHFRQQAYFQNLLLKVLLQLSTKEIKLPINNGQINETDCSKQ